YSQHEIYRRIRRSSDGWIVYIYSHVVTWLGSRVEYSSSLEIQGRSNDLKERGVSSGDSKVIVPEAVVGYNNVAKFDRRRRACVLRDRGNSVVKSDRGGRLVRGVRGRISPELRMIAITTAIFADGIEVAVTV